MKEVQASVVWYYCSSEVFENLMTEHKLWLSDITQSNDSNEIFSTLASLEDMCRQAIDLRFSNADKRLMDSIKSKLHRIIQKTKNICFWGAMCFSERRNDLSQWRTYGENGKGYAIGFRTEKLKELVAKYTFSSRKLAFAKVNYVAPLDTDIFFSKPSDDLRVKELAAMAQELCTKLAGLNAGLSRKDNCLSERGEMVIDEFIKSIILQIAYYKDNYYSGENEDRICYAKYIHPQGITEDALQQKQESLMNSLDFSVREGAIVPHIVLDPDSLENLGFQGLIDEIMIGPQNLVGEEMIKRFLAKKGKMEVENDFRIKGILVTKSTISCR